MSDKTIQYGDDGATFDPVCPKCGRFVKADKQTWFDKDGKPVTNATCKKCGRVTMPFLGFL